MGHKNHIGLTIVTFLLGVSFACAQNKTVVLHGTITDSTHKAIPFAAIQNSFTGEGINSDQNGQYIFRTKVPAALSVYSLGYDIINKQVDYVNKDSLEIDFELKQSAEELQTVVISASHPAKLLTEAPNLMDFELKDNMLWQVYSVKGGDRLTVTDTGGNQIATATYNYYFHKDSIGQTPYGPLYSIYKDSIQLFTLDKNNQIKKKAMSLREYKSYAEALVGFRFPLYYYKSYDSLETRINYTVFDRQTNTKKIFYRFMDTKLYKENRDIEDRMLFVQYMLLLKDSLNFPDIEALRDQEDNMYSGNSNIQSYAQVKNDITAKALSSGASVQEAENALAEAQSHVNLEYDIVETNQIERQALSMMKNNVFSWLRIVNDSVYIFNFDNHMISVYSPDNVYVRQVPFDFYMHYGFDWHPLRYRKINILVDGEKQECYYYQKSWGYTYIGKINLASGKITSNIKLKYPFISKVRISGGYAYFSYFNNQERDNIYNGKTCIYKQRLD